MAQQGGAASRLARRWFGGNFAGVPRVVTVGTAQVEAVPFDSNRIGLVVRNVGSTNITLSPVQPVVAGTGVVLSSGGVMTLDFLHDADMASQQWYALGDAAAGSLYVLENRQQYENIETEA